VKQGAAVLLPDAEAVELLKKTIDSLLQDEKQASALAENIKKLAMPDAATAIVSELERIIK
jgi:UDP-N-acetylglucosamine--N-acetylmuramyl-(pentapeptide) pyrophosphoryl-undecaprenol N-acetylglucosamine transferase